MLIDLDPEDMALLDAVVRMQLLILGSYLVDCIRLQDAKRMAETQTQIAQLESLAKKLGVALSR